MGKNEMKYETKTASMWQQIMSQCFCCGFLQNRAKTDILCLKNIIKLCEKLSLKNVSLCPLDIPLVSSPQPGFSSHDPLCLRRWPNQQARWCQEAAHLRLTVFVLVESNMKNARSSLWLPDNKTPRSCDVIMVATSQPRDVILLD